MSLRDELEPILDGLDVKINGDRPWDIQVNNDAFYEQVVYRGTLGLGESYVENHWNCDDIAEFVSRAITGIEKRNLRPNLRLALYYLYSKIFNRQNVARSMQVAERHYNIGNDIYMAFLDKYNQYTCGYFKDTQDLDAAQEKKLNLICQKLDLKHGEKILDVGCGWGGLARFAAERYGVHVTGISISTEQIEFARDYCRGLPVAIENCDYRFMTGKFDKIVSVGMLEHVGYKNYRKYMQKISELLYDEGLFLLHTIGGVRSVTATEPWVDKYIFPNGMLASSGQICSAADDIFIVEDVENFGLYYDRTLHCWSENLERNWPSISEEYGGDRTFRLWKYFFLMSAGTFRARENQVWQFVFSKPVRRQIYDRLECLEDTQ